MYVQQTLSSFQFTFIKNAAVTFTTAAAETGTASLTAVPTQTVVDTLVAIDATPRTLEIQINATDVLFSINGTQKADIPLTDPGITLSASQATQASVAFSNVRLYRDTAIFNTYKATATSLLTAGTKFQVTGMPLKTYAQITSVQVLSNLLTISTTYPNTGVGITNGTLINFFGLANATFLNGQQVTVNGGNGATTFTAPFTHSDYGPTNDYGNAGISSNAASADLQNQQIVSISGGEGFISHADLNTVAKVSLTTNVVTVTTSTDHGYTVGQEIGFANLSNSWSGFLQGSLVFFTVASVPTTTTLTFSMVHANVLETMEVGLIFPWIASASLSIANAGDATGLLTAVDGPGPFNFTGGLWVWPNLINAANAFVVANVSHVYYDEAI